MGDQDRMAMYAVLPSTREAIAVEVNQANELLGVLKAWQVDTEDDAEQAASILKETNERHKTLDKQRKEAIGPALLAQKEINDLFRPAIQAWNEAKNMTKRLLSERMARIEAANRAKMEEAVQGNAEALQQIQPAPAAPKGTSQRDEIEIKIIDESRIPREYLCIDWSALKIAAREGKPAPPGVEFVRVTKVQPTGR